MIAACNLQHVSGLRRRKPPTDGGRARPALPHVAVPVMPPDSRPGGLRNRLRRRRAERWLPPPQPGCSTLHLAINSLAAYSVPRARLLAQLRAAGVPMRQVHVFLGGSGLEGSDSFVGAEGAASGVRHYRVRHNSVDFTAMVHIAENSPSRLFGEDVRQWFYMHDTTGVGPGFWPNVTRWCDRLPACGLPLTRYYPSSSMGLYDAAFLSEHRAEVLALKNARGAPAHVFKRRGFGWEDKLFKVCDKASPDAPIRRFTRQCANVTLGRRTCICSRVDIEPQPVRVYSTDSTPRQAWRFGCVDLYKYKANWARNRTMIMAP